MKLENINLFIDEKKILRDINLQWKQGEAIALLGSNGAGKSSLLKVLSTLLKPSSGKMNYPDGMSVKEWKESLGVIFPESFLYNSLTSLENLEFYQKLYGDTDRGRLNEVLEQVSLLHVKDELVHSYSKGMKQRLSIARALIHKPTHLLLDEPFDGLDFVSRQILEELLEQVQEKGGSCIIVSHDSEHAWRLADRALLMHEGSILMEKQCTNQHYSTFIEQYKRAVNGNLSRVY